MQKRIFDLTRSDGKSLQERTLKLAEETGELSQAVLSATGAHGSSYKGLTLSDVREEAVDTAIVALSILAQTCADEEAFQEEFQSLFDKKLSKWAAVLER